MPLQPCDRVRPVKKDLVFRALAGEKLKLPRDVELLGRGHNDRHHHLPGRFGGPYFGREPDEFCLRDLNFRPAHIYHDAPAVEHVSVGIDPCPVRRDVRVGEHAGACDDNDPARSRSKL